MSLAGITCIFGWSALCSGSVAGGALATQNIIKGPAAYENWIAMLRGKPTSGAIEFPLYSDAHVANEITNGCGPYQFLNAISGGAPRGQAVPVLFARVEVHLPTENPNFERTDDSTYHGGWIDEELAALWSLLLGIRLRAGTETRRFNLGGDPRGTPYFGPSTKVPTIPLSGHEVILPSVRGSRNIVAGFFADYHRLAPPDVVALVRAARLYQNAVWLAEADPNLAWLMFVSALETVAVRWRTSDGEPTEILRTLKPQWAEILERGGTEVLTQMSAQLVPLLGATKRFLDFTEEFSPGIPERRPPEGFRRDWSPKALKKVLNVVYDYRSKALHAGTPFPGPMCNGPIMHPPWDAPGETPMGLAASMGGGVWTRKDYPVLLHSFEYITRGVLLNWWRSVIPQTQPSENATDRNNQQ